MNLKRKITTAAVLLAIIPLIIASVIINVLSINESKKVLNYEAKERLVAVRGLTKRRIEDYFGTISKQVRTFSEDHMVRESMHNFKSSFNAYTTEMAYSGLDIRQKKSKLASYYKNDFSTEYGKRNQGASPKVEAWLSSLGSTATALQEAFIQGNPNPLGSKEKLTKLQNPSSYAKWHSHYHPVFRDYLEKFEFYDIFLVDVDTGNIVYSVFKELDFATSIRDGSFANSGIGEVFEKASKAKTKDTVILSDFSSYSPSYQDPASFIASPVFDGGKVTGVLIFQMPIGKINEVMTHKNAWAKNGLGASGETYLVGEDSTLRSQSRFLLEDKAGYLDALASAGVSPELLNTIKSKDTSISLQPANTKGTKAALAGTTGFDIFPDYRNVPVLSAYAPIEIEGVNWAIMAEIDEAEAFAPATSLALELWLTMLAAIVILGAVVTVIGIRIANSLATPVLLFSSGIKEIQEQSDLTSSIDVERDDELGEAAKSFNKMLAKFRSSMQDVSGGTSKLAETVNQTIRVTTSSNEAIQTQLSEFSHVREAMLEMHSSVGELRKTVDNISEIAGSANEQTNSGRGAVNRTIDQVEKLSEEIGAAKGVIQKVESDSLEIGNVLIVIKSIADQTNLLALNAAIEAARAGEHGRGFAVVADEVRNLASKTQESTSEIEATIEKLQSGSTKAVVAITNSQEKAAGALEQISLAGQAIGAIDQINDMSNIVSSAAAKQTHAVDEVQKSIDLIYNMTEQTASGTQQTSEATEALTNLARELQGLVAQFKV